MFKFKAVETIESNSIEFDNLDNFIDYLDKEYSDHQYRNKFCIINARPDVDISNIECYCEFIVFAIKDRNFIFTIMNTKRKTCCEIKRYKD